MGIVGWIIVIIVVVLVVGMIACNRSRSCKPSSVFDTFDILD